MAEQKTLQLNIARVDGSLFMGEVVSVTVPGSEGEMTLLPDHTPLVSALRAGTITLRKADGEAEEFPVVSGTLEVSKNSVTILL
ncbi:ATP synthase F1 subunit epsilon [Candidatus Kaiserbacteria bacterium RIFCSPLOWO2_02_FULL_45_11b]|uniref:ATP synthase F1 subunit epsilon n=1 Tax=Candidatus Kaiserbacteria bacterium RIFCSPLOWO2_12_FULL_45_26 TaxID=1798525 RepID=A0A1F6FHA5_9BACT|nr:MAG: ATP synthase F1 subunit epsilon [Candidatus Kaiserbacteria bacterium RIFCSPHIGHO2_12_45_16]OGG70881.1 MAG: ATP synthase F1 subunit epsilon [Candidatus Kaiserbacteria bacterium RIFCSPLOWO2_01_FULL_45_25]OGG83750.1 MAG: ATP synthase F1 subunit epsilon [Candidatus Kaiserbacteria bacterium RIFCSPLOWO2_02_FULL_45_11b]OGG85244.1 MAG: ATP synthase F1 subunit epsilon [Candidatus Kaiserbacteria bacterium RIFCSPLOWO2_12_FULL_45_26]